MVVIRLARAGAKKRPFYHVVVADKRHKRDGRFIERLGFYDPLASGQAIKCKIDLERLEYWHAKGAQSSERVEWLKKNHQKLTNSISTESQTLAQQETLSEPVVISTPPLEEHV